MFPELKQFIDRLDLTKISKERKPALQPLVDYIEEKLSHQQEIRLNFICTHNSRRSHFSQVWAQALAFHFGIKNITCYSGGTEATAVYPSVVETLKNSGFKIIKLSEGPNSVYSIKFSENEHPVIAFSKKFDEEFNPESGFAAIMTCSQADEGCPFIAGAERRIAINFEDPKSADGTCRESEKYEEKNLEIATDLLYVFSQINQR